MVTLGSSIIVIENADEVHIPVSWAIKTAVKENSRVWMSDGP
jgi:hypothetical protein